MPAQARSTDPWTSWAAANSVGELRPRQAAVYWVLRQYGPLSLSQLVDRYRRLIPMGGMAGAHDRSVPALPPQSDSGIRTRAKELGDLHLVAPTGDTRRNDAGNVERLLDVVRSTLFA